MDELATILLAVLTMGRRWRLDDATIVTAQSLAWYWSSRSPTTRPAHWWAYLACRHARCGRDLADCGTGHADALSHSVQGGTMAGVMDDSPGPDILASETELWALRMEGLTGKKLKVVELRISGMSNEDIARELNLTPGRISQIAREVVS